MSAYRDEKGRFAPGNPGSPGRNPRRAEQKYLDATIAQVSLADWQKVVKKALADAMAGDAQARAWLGNYILGTPPKIIELRGAELYALRDLLDLMREQQLPAGELFEALFAELSADYDPADYVPLESGDE